MMIFCRFVVAHTVCCCIVATGVSFETGSSLPLKTKPKIHVIYFCCMCRKVIEMLDIVSRQFSKFGKMCVANVTTRAKATQPFQHLMQNTI